MLWVIISLRQGVLDTTLCDKVCQWLAAGLWFSLGIPVSTTNNTDCHDIMEILLKVSLNTLTLTLIKEAWLHILVILFLSNSQIVLHTFLYCFSSCDIRYKIPPSPVPLLYPITDKKLYQLNDEYFADKVIA
jgi:hypothetical protein